MANILLFPLMEIITISIIANGIIKAVEGIKTTKGRETAGPEGPGSDVRKAAS